jgi:SAM-dependent methyltransferase
MDQRDSVRRAYDGLAEAYAAHRSTDGRDVEILSEFLRRLPDEPRLLDAGCGQGTPVLRRLDSAGRAVGLDFSAEQLRLAADAVPDAPLALGDLTRLPFAPDVFDGIVSFHALIHVPLAEHQTVADEFARVLRPGGRLLVSEGPGEWRGSNPDWLDTGVEMQWSIAGAAATRTHLENAGFTVVDEWAVDDGEHWVFLAAELDA